MNTIFYIACFLLPFENFFFAPSEGWAALSPIVFFIYIFLNIKYIGKVVNKYRSIIIILSVAIIITLVNILYIDEYYIEGTHRFISAMISIVMGLSCLFAFEIFFIQKNGNIKKIEKIIMWAYTISLCVGVIQYLAIRYNIMFIRILDASLVKRNYLWLNRVQFTFTEPSFIGMHIFGVLFPIYILGKNKNIAKLIIAYCLAAVFFGSGVRVLLDILVSVVIYFFYKIDFKKARNVAIVIITPILLVTSFMYMYNNNYRVQQIVKFGVYSDGSFASRWFRVNASLKGYQKDIAHILVGYGIGQEVIPQKLGYTDAVKEYKNYYMDEVRGLKDAISTSEESVSYCFYIRLISEFGLVMSVLLLVILIRKYRDISSKQWKSVIMIAIYLMVQFESYGFYTIWLVIVLSQFYCKGKRNISCYEKE